MRTKPKPRQTGRVRGRAALGAAFLLVALIAGAAIASGQPSSGYPADKAAREQKWKQQGEQARTGQPPPLPTRKPDPPRPTGILVGVPVPLDAHTYSIQNMWQERLGDTYVDVYAGALHDNPVQGVLVEMTTPVDLLNGQGNQTGPDQYLTPTPHGAVKVVSYTGSRLMLTAEDGTGFVFDTQTRQFAST